MNNTIIKLRFGIALLTSVLSFNAYADLMTDCKVCQAKCENLLGGQGAKEVNACKQSNKCLDCSVYEGRQ